MSMRDGPAHCALTTLQTLPSMVVDLRLFNDVLVAATQCQGAVVWRQVSGLIADAPPTTLLTCGGAIIGLCVLDGSITIAPCADATVRVWKQDNPVCLTLGGLRRCNPSCCGVPSLNKIGTIVVAVSNGEGGILLWPIDDHTAPSDALGLDSRCARRLPNISQTAKAVEVVTSGKNEILATFDDGSLKVFQLTNDEDGLNATLLHTYFTHIRWGFANLMPIGRQKKGPIFATRAGRPTSLLLTWV